MSTFDRRGAALGAAAGIAATLAFMVLHQLTISDIWFSTVPMVLAGALCGAALAVHHGLLFEEHTGWSWLGYVTLHFALLVGLGLASVAWFDPVMPVAVAMNLDGPPDDLIAQAGPLTVVYVLGATAALSAWRGRSAGKVAATLVTCSLMFVLLGINVSVLGLIEWSSDGIGVLLEFFGLIAVILYSYGGLYAVLHRLAR